MRIAVPLLLALLLPKAIPAAPTQDWSALIATGGLARTEATLAALPTPTPDDLFTLGGVRFLMGVEQALHLRWQVGATDPMFPIPVLRLHLPPNPAPQPRRAALVADIFAALTASMTRADAALAAIPPGATVGTTITLADLWLDIDGDGTRSAAEELLPLAMDAFTMPFADPAAPPVTQVRFDTADAAWLRAYGHLIAGVGSFVLAFDPTAATQRVMDAATDKAARLASPNPSTLDQLVDQQWIDAAAIAILTLRQQPDATLTRQTAAHFTQVVAQNRIFWREVAQEADNQSEWIPNAHQTAALGYTLPPDTDVVWLGVLGELDLMLQGKLLVPHIALPPEAGIDIGKWLQDPNPLDLAGWIQGMDALPYAARGPVLSDRAWTTFEQMMEGRGLLFAFLLN